MVAVPSPTFFETRSKAQFVADALPSAALHTRATSARATERVPPEANAGSFMISSFTPTTSSRFEPSSSTKPPG